MKGLCALLVDDDDDIREVGKIAMEDFGGFRALLASSGTQALELAREHRPDVILLDVMMPGLDGPATLSRLRADPEVASIPVIFLTAKVQRSEVQRYLEIGAIGVIAKPFDPTTLPDEVRALLRVASPPSDG